MNLLDSLFGSLIPEKDTAEALLLARVVDLELAVAHSDPVSQREALDRIRSRTDRHVASAMQKEKFLNAFRADLEVAHLHNIVNTNQTSGHPKIEGHRSLSAGIHAYELAQSDLWEQALNFFKEAERLAHGYWPRSCKACEEVISELSRHTDSELVSISRIEELFSELDAVGPEHHLIEVVNASTPLAWLEAWHRFSKGSLAFKGIVTDEMLQVAREGKWELWISYEESKTSGETRKVTPRRRYSSEAKKTLLGKHFKDLEDPSAKAQEERFWMVFWWGAGCNPEWGLKNFKVHQHADDGLFYLDQHDIRTEILDGKYVKTDVWGPTHKDWPKGVETYDEAFAMSWKFKIFGRF